MENQNPNQSTQKEEPVTPTLPPSAFPTPAHPLPKFLPKPIALIVIVLIVGTLLSGLVFTVYTLGRNSVFKELNPTAPVIPPPGPVFQASPTPNPTDNWKTYTNTNLRVSMEIPSSFEVIEETESEVVLGSKPAPTEEAIPYLTISKVIKTPYQSYPLCEKAPNSFPCKENEVLSTTIDGKSVDTVRITGGVDSLDELIVLIGANTVPKEVKMSVAGGGLADIFSHIKSTIKFN